ncbi:MAG: DUF423 domain-containing protein [Candidatus Dadabacteria bacterium]|nr:MAG: DUF423 domain-containing protein [Candidatus Dadabacteria bacterium]
MIWSAIGALALMIAVGTGAFGAHGLKGRLSPEMLSVWETAVRYQAWHGLALLVVGFQVDRFSGLWPVCALYAAGILMFSGSLYVLALDGPRWLGPVTPLGGTAWLIGHGWLAWRLWQASRGA